MPAGEPPGPLVHSFDELLRATDCASAAQLADKVNWRMDRNGFVDIHWDTEDLEVVVGFGDRALTAEFRFPFRLKKFWATVNEYADEVEE